jgi:heptosyltransferase-3
MRLLFVKLRHIGDALIMTAMLSAVRRNHPHAQIWVVVRKGCEGILAGCPAIDRILTAAPAERENRSGLAWWHELQMVAELRRQHFDHAFELGDNGHGRWLAWLSGAKSVGADEGQRQVGWWWSKRFSLLQMQFASRKAMHRAEKDFNIVQQLLPLTGDVPPMEFHRDRCAPWEASGLRTPFIVFHPGTRWLRKRWPVERWFELGRHLAGLGFQIVISAGPDAEEVALGDELVKSIGGDTLSTGGKTGWRQLAWLLHRARMFVGVDTAAMHLAAACQCPTVAIFGPSWIPAWRPWKVIHRVVSPAPLPSPDPTVDPDEVQRSLIAKIPLGEVASACAAVLAETPERGVAGVK